MNFADFWATNSHENPVTGCRIWDGELSKGNPVGGGLQIRKVVYESANGPQAYRTKFLPSCENTLCVKPEHIVTVQPEKQVHNYPADKVDEAYKLHSEGLRQDAIATRMGLDPSTISKYIKQAKAQLAEANDA